MGRKQVYSRVQIERSHNRDLDLLKFAIQQDWDIWTVALNNVFGFGKKRIERLQAEANALYGKYADCLSLDADYADTVLARRVAQIMGEEYLSK